MKRVGIIAAMDAELAPLREELQVLGLPTPLTLGDSKPVQCANIP